MSGAKLILWIWTVLVISITVLILQLILATRTYSGSEIAFMATSDHYIDLDTTNPIDIEAADSEYFQFVQGETYIYGIPETPPLDYVSDKYYRLEAQLQKGRWLVAEGSSISIELMNDKSFDVTYFPTKDKISDTIIMGVMISICIWLLFVLIGWIIYDEL